MDGFNIIDIIINAIEVKLEIPCFNQICTEDLDHAYVIFKVIDSRSGMILDNVSNCEYYNIDITFWSNNPKDLLRYREIINSLKLNGFRYLRSFDLLDENSSQVNQENKYYGKLMEFKYKHMFNF